MIIRVIYIFLKRKKNSLKKRSDRRELYLKGELLIEIVAPQGLPPVHTACNTSGTSARPDLSGPGFRGPQFYGHAHGRNAAQRGFHPCRNPSTGWFKVPPAVPLSPAVPFSTRFSAGMNPPMGRDSSVNILNTSRHKALNTRLDTPLASTVDLS